MSKNFISIFSLSPSDKAIIEKAYSVYLKKIDSLYGDNVISLYDAIDSFNYPKFLLYLCRNFLDSGVVSDE